MLLNRNKAMSAGHQTSDHSNLKPEPDNLPIGFLGGFIFAILVVMVFVAVVSRELLLTTAEYQTNTVNTGVPSRQITEIRSQEAAVLESYDVVDEAQGRYRVPVGVAIDEYVRRQGAQQ
jgi:hypothetical protein